MPNTTPHATPPLTISRAVAGTLFLILSVALVAAAADLFAAVSEHGRKLAGARAAGGMTVTGTLALAFALLVVLVSALLPAKIARAALSARAVGGAIAAATMAVVIIYPGVPPHRLTEQPTILIAAFFAGVAAFAAGSRLGSDSWRSGWRGMVRALVAAFPIAAIGAAAVMFDVKVTRSQPGAIAGIAAFATVFAALTAFFLRRFGPRVALVPVAVIAILTGLGGARELHRGRASLVIPAPKNAPPKGVRHVVMLTIDTLRTDALRLYSDSGTSAPNLETLAGDSIVFTNAYTPGPWTLPSISTFLTGLSPDAHGARYHKDRLPSNVRMLAQRFGEAGYVTAGIGRNIFIRMNMERGFEHFDFYPKKESEELFGETVWEETYGDPQPGDIDTPEIARRAIRWLDANADKGFFFWVHFFDPHYPYAPPGKYRPKRRPPAGMGYSFHELKRVRGGYLMPTAKQREWIRELYLGEVRYVDAYAGRVLNHLRKLGLYDDALILFASDHGDEFWEHGGFEHGHAIHDELLRVPMMVKLPGGAKPVERIDTRASLTMLAPTLLELAGIAFDPADMSEPSLAPVLRGEEPAAERTIFASGNLFYDKKEAVIFDGMKYIHREVPEREELFDLAADPGETTNIALAHPDLIERARGLLADHARAEKIRRSEMRIRQSAHKALDESAAEAMRSLGYLQ